MRAIREHGTTIALLIIAAGIAVTLGWRPSVLAVLFCVVGAIVGTILGRWLLNRLPWHHGDDE